jgi:hypothetical protein
MSRVAVKLARPLTRQATGCQEANLMRFNWTRKRASDLYSTDSDEVMYEVVVPVEVVFAFGHRPTVAEVNAELDVLVPEDPDVFLNFRSL